METLLFGVSGHRSLTLGGIDVLLAVWLAGIIIPERRANETDGTLNLNAAMEGKGSDGDSTSRLEYAFRMLTGNPLLRCRRGDTGGGDGANTAIFSVVQVRLSLKPFPFIMRAMVTARSNLSWPELSDVRKRRAILRGRRHSA